MSQPQRRLEGSTTPRPAPQTYGVKCPYCKKRLDVNESVLKKVRNKSYSQAECPGCHHRLWIVLQDHKPVAIEDPNALRPDKEIPFADADGQEHLESLAQRVRQIQGDLHELKEAVFGVAGGENRIANIQETLAALNKELSALSEKRQLGMKPADLQEMFDHYARWLLEQRGKTRHFEIIERLPDLFDLIDMELYSWRRREDVASEEERQRVCNVLETLQAGMRDWQNRVGLVRFPEVGESWHRAMHEVVRWETTEDPYEESIVKEVVHSGYRLHADGRVLRTALVVLSTTSRPEGTGA